MEDDGKRHRFYFAGSVRIAMRAQVNGAADQVYYLLADHLGSTTVSYRADGLETRFQSYKPWGEFRESGNSLPTDRTYTGQRWSASIGLHFYNARWFDSYLNRWIQPDGIIPEPGNVQDWDHFAYARNNPVKYTDPDGHRPDDGCRTEGCDIWKPKSDADKRNWAFTNMFIGSGNAGAWTSDDWDFYLNNYNNLWAGKIQWKNPDSAVGWDLFALHVERLASQYSPEQTDQFVRDFALIFAGITATGNWEDAALAAAGGPTLPFLNESNQGLPTKYLDSLSDSTNQSHHYAGIFFLSYFAGAGPGAMVNFGRDTIDPKNRRIEVNSGDIRLGNIASLHAMKIKGKVWGNTFFDLSAWIDHMTP